MSGGRGKVLTQELVFNKTKSDNLQNIKNLNLWGNELEDLSLIQKMPNLQVISISVNRISSLKDFSKCQKLQELYLRKNNIADIRQIRYLLKLPMLKVLWLQDNPCASIDNYRETVIHYLPNLAKLDNNVVTQEEKMTSLKPQFQIEGIMPQSQVTAQKLPTPQPIEKPILRISEQRKNRQIPEPVKEQKQQIQHNWRNNKQPRNNYSNNEYESTPNQSQMNRNRNILIAVLSLMKELDVGSLQIIRKQSERLIRQS